MAGRYSEEFRSDVIRLVKGGLSVAQVSKETGVPVVMDTAGADNVTKWDRTPTGSYISHAYVYSGTLPVCAGSNTPAPSVTLTPAEFIAASVPGAQRGWREYGVPPSVTIAQAILESGWGRSGLASVDLDRIRKRVESTDWVDSAVVTRVWPDAIRVVVNEQVAAARWNDAGLLNARGELFIRNARFVPPELPSLEGPEGSEGEVAQLSLDANNNLYAVGTVYKPAAA